MRLFMARFGLPLLSRELIQLSARRRTYVIRSLYAVALYGAALWFYWQWCGRFPSDSFEVLGQGKSFFEQIVRWQFVGIYLFLPVLTCGAITSEKERQTLQLLQLTKLSGMTILLEKLFSRLMEMGTFLLLSLPLAAMAYGLGGVEEGDILKAVYVLVITSLQVGCFSLLCSTWFRTTAGSMVAVYLIGGAGMICGSWLLRLLSFTDNFSDHALSGPWVLGLRSVMYESSTGFIDLDSSQHAEEILSFELPNPLIRWLTSATSGRLTASSFEDVVERSTGLVASAAVCLLLARTCLWRRVATRHRSHLKSFFILLDHLYAHLNPNSFTRGITFGATGRELPIDRPIAWAETRRTLGQTHHLIRLLLLVEAPLVAWLAAHMAIPSGLPVTLSTLWTGLWLIALLVVIAVSTSLVPGERSRQTLDVLLVAPITAAEIVLQKTAGLRRLIVFLWVPLLTVLATQTLWMLNVDRNATFGFRESRIFDDEILGDQILLVLRRLAAMGLYLPLVGWLGFLFGLRLKNQFHAILAVLFTLLSVCGTPLVVEWSVDTFDPFGLNHSFPGLVLLGVLNWMNPWFVVLHSERFDRGYFDEFLTSDIFPRDWFPFLFHFLIVGGMLWGVRRNALKSFSRFVRRLEPVISRHVNHPQLSSDANILIFPDSPTSFRSSDTNPVDAKPALPSHGTNNE